MSTDRTRNDYPIENEDGAGPNRQPPTANR